MNEIYKTAMEFAGEQKATIIKLEIYFNYNTQSYGGHVQLSNGNKYTILQSTKWNKEKGETND